MRFPSRIQSIFFNVVHAREPGQDRRWSQRLRLVTAQACRKGKAGKRLPVLKIRSSYSCRSHLKLMSFCKLLQLPTFTLL